MKNTQLKQILNLLKQGKTISQAEAIDMFNCYRLSAIIQRLRCAGYDIVTHRERNYSGIGSHARYGDRSTHHECIYWSDFPNESTD